MVNVDAVRIDGDWRERQSREFKALPGERKARLFHPGFLPFEIQNPKRQSQPGGISPGDDDLRWRAVDAAGHGEIACDLAPALELATRIRIDRKSVVSGKSVSVRVALGGRRSIKKKKIR